MEHLDKNHTLRLLYADNLQIFKLFNELKTTTININNKGDQASYIDQAMTLSVTLDSTLT